MAGPARMADRLTRALGGLLRRWARVLPPGRRGWAEAVRAEAGEVPGGRGWAGWRAGCGWWPGRPGWRAGSGTGWGSRLWR